MKQKLLGMLTGVILLSGLFGTVNAKAYVTCSRNQAVEWAIAQIGKALDYDGAYGAQCVDLIKYYYAYLGEKPVRGNGKDYATNALPSGWSRIRYYNGFIPEPGDIAVWTTGGGGYGHVAIITSADVNGFRSVDQNISGTTGCVAMSWSYSTLWGIVRPDFIDDAEFKAVGIYVPEYEAGGVISAGMAVSPPNEEAVQYQWLVYDIANESWSLISDWSKSNWVSWKPERGGNYWLHCKARNVEGKEVSSTVGITYREPEFKAIGIYVPEYEAGGTISAGMAVSLPNEEAVQYQWLVYDIANESWSLVSDWSESNWVSWKPERGGNYWLHCKVRNAEGKEVSSTVGITYTEPEFKAVGIYVPEYEAGGTISAGMAVSPSNEEAVQYQWLAYDIEKESWSLISDWSEGNWVSWKPERGGNYWLHCKARNVEGKEVSSTVGITYREPEFKAVGIYVPEYEPGAPVLAGMVVTPSDEVGVQYQWLAYDTKNESWSLVSDWSDSNWVSWQPEKGGDYWLHCYAKNQKGEIVFNTVSMHYDTCE